MSKLLSANSRADIYQRVTDTVIRDLEQGTRPWIKPWTTSSSDTTTIRPLRHDGTPYRGINVLILWSEATEQGYTSSTWMTYRQAQTLGAQVRKGERGATVVYAKTIDRAEDELTTGDETVTRIPVCCVLTPSSTPIRSKACRHRNRLNRPNHRVRVNSDRARRRLHRRDRGHHRAQGQPRLLHSVCRSH